MQIKLIGKTKKYCEHSKTQNGAILSEKLSMVNKDTFFSSDAR